MTHIQIIAVDFTRSGYPLVRDRIRRSVVVPLRIAGCFAGNVRVAWLSILVALCLLAVPLAQGQKAATAVATTIPLGTNTGAGIQVAATKTVPVKRPVEQEITEETMISYGDYRIFGATARCQVWTSGLEYDRHIWGRHLKAQVDYVAEVLPFVLLSQPAKADIYGNPQSPNQELVPGLGVSPFGFRFLWRSGQRIKPYLIAKAGAVAFTKKALSPGASYAIFNFQGEVRVEIRLTDRVELRLGPIEHFHVSNAYLTASNPGMDELGGKIGVSYHIGRRGER